MSSEGPRSKIEMALTTCMKTEVQEVSLMWGGPDIFAQLMSQYYYSDACLDGIKPVVQTRL